MRGICVGLVLAATACGPAPGYEPASPPPVTASETVADVRPPPAPGELEDRCDRARRWLERGRALRREGWPQRAGRLLAHAEAACRDAVDDDTRRQLAAPPAALAGARLVSRPEGRLLGASRDGALVILSPERGYDRDADTTLVLLDGNSGRPAYVIAAKGHAAHADVHGDRLIAVAGDGIDVYALARGQRERRLSWTDETYLWAALIDEGRRVVAVGRSWPRGVVRVFDAASGDALGSIAPENAASFEAAALVDDATLVAASDGVVFVIDLKAMAVARQLEVPPVDKRASDVQALAAHAGRVAAATRDHRLLVWDAGQTKPIADMLVDGQPSSLALSRDGTRLSVALTPFGGELKTFDVNSKMAVRSRPLPRRDVWFTPGAERLFVSGYGSSGLEDIEGKALWPPVTPASTPEGVALSHGLAVAEERRGDGGNATIVMRGWYRGQLRRFEQPGYREEVLAISPSGRHVAAIVGRDGWLWDLSTGGQVPFSTPDARGFPDTLAFAGASTLRLVFERPLASFVADLPFDGWRPDFAPGTLDGFYGTAVSLHGDLLSDDQHVITLAKPHKTLLEKAGGFAFSGDGERIFVGTDKRLVWFDRQGAPQGELALDCTPDEMAADQAGKVVAFECGHHRLAVVTLPGGVRKLAAELDVDSVHVSPSGHLVLVRSDGELRFFAASDLQERASMTFRGEPLMHAPDGRVLFWEDEPAWRDTTSCLVGHRARPAAECFDALIDDALLDALLAP